MSEKARKAKKVYRVDSSSKDQAARGAKEDGGIIDEQVSRIFTMLEANRQRIIDLHDRLGGPFPSGGAEVPSDGICDTIPAALDSILSKLCNEQDSIEAIHEHIGNKLGRIKLY